MIAAGAGQAGIGVLHYDRLAEVLDFDSRWIAAPGTFVGLARQPPDPSIRAA